ncbi:MAG: hypothetical protein U0575_16155 [Phycisphaerales bacterium]
MLAVMVVSRVVEDFQATHDSAKRHGRVLSQSPTTLPSRRGQDVLDAMIDAGIEERIDEGTGERIDEKTDESIDESVERIDEGIAATIDRDD